MNQVQKDDAHWVCQILQQANLKFHPISANTQLIIENKVVYSHLTGLWYGRDPSHPAAGSGIFPLFLHLNTPLPLEMPDHPSVVREKGKASRRDGCKSKYQKVRDDLLASKRWFNTHSVAQRNKIRRRYNEWKEEQKALGQKYIAFQHFYRQIIAGDLALTSAVS